MSFDFRNLEVYQKAKAFHALCLSLSEHTKATPHARDQLHRASMSVVLNIAEGSGKFSKPDRRSFFVIARASVFECVAIADILFDQGRISSEAFHEFLNLAETLSKILFAMIRNLNSKQPGG